MKGENDILFLNRISVGQMMQPDAQTLVLEQKNIFFLATRFKKEGKSAITSKATLRIALPSVGLGCRRCTATDWRREK